MKRMNRLFLPVLVLFAVMMLGGCNSGKSSVEKLRDLEFTVVENADLPEELKNLIDEKKAEPFKLSYGNEEYLYIVMGYGEQITGGYSIQIDDLYETDNAIYFDSTLIGPSKEESVEKATSYPYIVAKIEFMDKSVVFE